MNKVESLELKVKELENKLKEQEDAILKLRQEYRNQIYELDANNFSRDFLKKIGYTESK